MKNPVEIIESYSNGENEYNLGDILLACNQLNEPIKYDTCIKLLKIMDENTECYGVVAKMLVPVFAKIENEEIIISLLSKIIKYKPAVESLIEGNYGHLTKAKELALNHLSTINSDKARVEIAMAIKYFDCAGAAATILSNNCSECESILVDFCNNGEWFQKENAARALAGSTLEESKTFLCELIKKRESQLAEIVTKSHQIYENKKDVKIEDKAIDRWKLSAATIKNDNGEILYLRSTTSAFNVLYRISKGNIVYTSEFISLRGVRTKYQEFLVFIQNNNNIADVKLPNGEQFKIKYTAGKHGGYSTSFVEMVI